MCGDLHAVLELEALVLDAGDERGPARVGRDARHNARRGLLACTEQRRHVSRRNKPGWWWLHAVPVLPELMHAGTAAFAVVVSAYCVTWGEAGTSLDTRALLHEGARCSCRVRDQ